MTQYEYGYETGYEFGPSYEAEAEGEYGPVGEYEAEGEYGPAGEYETGYEFGPGQELEAEYGGTGEFEAEGELHEVQEMELASELLEITNEAELEGFLGDVFKTVAKAAGGLIGGPVGQALLPMLKNVAKQALPAVTGALGSMIAPGVGTVLGSKLGSLASGLFEMEFEGMDHEQAEFEAARRYIQFATAAARNAAAAGPYLSPYQAAQQAFAAAAQRYAPGLLRQGYGYGYGYDGGTPYGAGYYGGQAPWTQGSTRAHSGRWARHGRKIVLYGV